MNLFVFFCFGLFFFFLRWWVWLTGYPNIKMGSKSQHCQTWYMKVVGTAFPSEWTSRACRGVRERQMGKNAFFVFLMDVPSWETTVSSCVPFGHAQWGRVSTWADWQQVSQQLPSFAPACRSPCPASPLLGHGPIHRLLRSQPARGWTNCFHPCLTASCHPLPLSCLSLLAICSWISLLRWASQGLQGQPRHSIANPGPSGWGWGWGPSAGSPTVVFHQVPPGVESQLSTPSPSLCAELCRPARGIP